MPLKTCPSDGLECCFAECEGDLCKARGDVAPDDRGVWHDRTGRVVPSLDGIRITIEYKDLELEIRADRESLSISQISNGTRLSDGAAHRLIRLIADDIEQSLQARRIAGTIAPS